MHGRSRHLYTSRKSLTADNAPPYLSYSVHNSRYRYSYICRSKRPKRKPMDTPFDGTIPAHVLPVPDKKPRRGLRRILRLPLMVAFPIALAVAGAYAYLKSEPFVSTDDAFIRAAKISINARVAGQVTEIAVIENQRVHKGDLLFRVDPDPYRITVQQAEAELERSRLEIDTLKTKYRQQLAELASAKHSAKAAQSFKPRFKPCPASG